MKVLVIGATGLIGSAVVRELASRGHHVVAISRGEQLADEEFVTYRRVDVNSPDLAEHFEGVDAVVNAFNAGWQNNNYVEDFKRGSSSIIEAARQASVPYLLCVGGAGSLFVAPGVQLVDTLSFQRPYIRQQVRLVISTTVSKSAEMSTGHTSLLPPCLWSLPLATNVPASIVSAQTTCY